MRETEETCVWSLGGKDPLEEGMATHSSIPAWRIPGTEEPGGQHCPQGHKELDVTEATLYAQVTTEDAYRSITQNPTQWD